MVKWIGFLLFLCAGIASAKGVYQTPNAFIQQAFHNAPPKPKVLWLTKTLRKKAESVMAHKVNMLRVRYWGGGNKTAWILEEIGKELPITVGIVVNNQRIEYVKVLEFRESRGGEVVHPFFTDQFHQVKLEQDFELSKHIHSISGATLSVRALTKLSRLALLFHQHTPAQ